MKPLHQSTGHLSRHRSGAVCRSKLLDSFDDIVYGFSTRLNGNVSLKLGDPAETRTNRQVLVSQIIGPSPRVVTIRSESGKRIGVVQDEHAGTTAAETPFHTSTDGLVTDIPGVLLLATFADCLPVFLFDPRTHAVGLVHAGWRGVIEGVVPNAVRAMGTAYRSSPPDITVFIGPSICSGCFEVQDDVWGRFESDEVGITGCFEDGKTRKVDLQRVCLNQLMAIGLGKANVEVSPECTCCDAAAYWSHRRDGQQRGAMAAMIGLTGVARNVDRPRSVPPAPADPPGRNGRRRNDQPRRAAS